MRLRMIRRCIPDGARVLDVGCADGSLYREAGPLGCYVGVDPDAPSDRPGANARFIRDVFPTALLDTAARFDVISVAAVLEHVPRGAQPAFAKACAAHLVPDGRLAITVPAPVVDSILGVLKNASLLDGMKEEEHYGFDPSVTPALFEPHGFALERHSRFELGLNHFFVFRRR
jgi:2-polyprenyl-3-methyl-5-hydroxy-6-metoxy-1,4-benzoquinol methylase